MGKIKHGHSIGSVISSEYHAWANAKNRCYRPKDIRYPRYGGRGITMCDRWRYSFAAFLADMGPRPPEVNTDGNYEPANCCWATNVEQARNRSTNRWLEYGGQRRTLTEWGHVTGLGTKKLWGKLKRGHELADLVVGAATVLSSS